MLFSFSTVTDVKLCYEGKYVFSVSQGKARNILFSCYLKILSPNKLGDPSVQFLC